MIRAHKTGLFRAARMVFTILGAALGLVVLFVLKYLVLLVLGTVAAMLVLMCPYRKPRLEELRDARRAAGETQPDLEDPGFTLIKGKQ